MCEPPLLMSAPALAPRPQQHIPVQVAAAQVGVIPAGTEGGRDDRSPQPWDDEEAEEEEEEEEEEARGQFPCTVEGCTHVARQRRFLAAHLRTHAGKKVGGCWRALL